MLRPRRFAVKQYFRILCGFPTKTARGFITIYVHNGRICRCLQNNFQFTKTNFTNVVVKEIYFQIKKKTFHFFKATDIFEIHYKLCRWHALTK